jgi:hypothetical protein
MRLRCTTPRACALLLAGPPAHAWVRCNLGPLNLSLRTASLSPMHHMIDAHHKIIDMVPVSSAIICEQVERRNLEFHFHCREIDRLQQSRKNARRMRPGGKKDLVPKPFVP